ncbi:hypothetical protein D9613_004408 [Agrocybe pediades]|uniref:Uncharacterized protein n=1 Tax=Agrocybe pediades TaxID=84607 RepID=A0A8H4QIS8_9AGAR|nr:hypothetical protein D9613_004408 [Agrocybe pediades]
MHSSNRDGATREVNLNTLRRVNTEKELIDFVFPVDVLNNPVLCKKRLIITAAPDQVHMYNERIIGLLPGVSRECFAAHSLEPAGFRSPYYREQDILELVPELNPSGFAPSKLIVKTGAVYRLMKNLPGVERGLFKGAHVIVTEQRSNILLVIKLVKEDGTVEDGEGTLLPRVNFTYDLPSGHTMVRRQFPLEPTYTVMLSEYEDKLGVERVGIDLWNQPLSQAQAQLQPVLSRIRSIKDDVAILSRQ